MLCPALQKSAGADPEGIRVVISRAFRGLAQVVLFLLALSAPDTGAHDIPNDVRVQAFLRPAGEQLLLLVRVPLAAMQDVDFPRRDPGYLDLPRADAALRTAATLWLTDNMEVFEGGRRLPAPRIGTVRVSLPSDPWFGSWDEAVAQLGAPRLPDDTTLYWNQGMLDVRLAYPIQSAASDFSINPKLGRLGLQTVIALRFLPPGGAERVFELHGNPGLVRLDPRWHQAALRFVEAGFTHILDGTDHLLFILCLVIPLRRLRTLIGIVTSFTVAHSVTLLASAFGHAPGGLWFPPLVETLIAVSIVYMALENIVGANLGRRWVITFAFGLVHGFGFSFALRDTLQFAGSHLVTSLLAFNVGVELGQLLVLIVLVPALVLLFRFVNERIATIVLSALVAHTAWHWMLERGDKLRQFPWPAFDAATAASAMRWAMALLVVGGIAWFGRDAIRRRVRRRHRPSEADGWSD
ncbi:MAG: HupE/UreJ family protein [Betaproteobacteria bacterium]